MPAPYREPPKSPKRAEPERAPTPRWPWLVLFGVPLAGVATYLLLGRTRPPLPVKSEPTNVVSSSIAPMSADALVDDGAAIEHVQNLAAEMEAMDAADAIRKVAPDAPSRAAAERMIAVLRGEDCQKFGVALAELHRALGAPAILPPPDADPSAGDVLAQLWLLDGFVRAACSPKSP